MFENKSTEETQKRSRRLITSFFSVIIILLMISTNPNKDQFKSYVKSVIEEESDRAGGLTGFVGNLFSSPTSWFMSLNTSRKNYMILSIYKVEVFDDTYYYVGAFNSFLLIH